VVKIESMDPYMPFYVEGRLDIGNEGVDVEIDVTEMATRVMNGEKIYDVTYSVSEAALKPKANSSFKRTWISDHASEIKDAGGDKEKAFGKFFSGQCDELRHMMEDEVADALEELLDNPDEEEDDEAEDEEDDGEPEDEHPEEPGEEDAGEDEK
jgi:hypothetical protein